MVTGEGEVEGEAGSGRGCRNVECTLTTLPMEWMEGTRAYFRETYLIVEAWLDEKVA